MDPKKAVVLVVLLLIAWPDADGKSRAQLASNEMAVGIYDGYMAVAQGSANGMTNLRFLLDTGASDTAIDRRVAEKLAVNGKPANVTSFEKTTASEWTELREITFGPERASNVRVVIEDLSYFGRIGLHIDGVIGLDQLRRQSFVVNYAKKYVAFGPVATAGMHATPMLANGRLVKVETGLDGRPVWMVADTGAPVTVLYEDILSQLTVNYRLDRRMDWLSLSGHLESRVAIVPRFQVGGQDLGREVILVSVPRAKRLSGVVGYLGVAALGAKVVAFDFDRNQLLWKK